MSELGATSSAATIVNLDLIADLIVSLSASWTKTWGAALYVASKHGVLLTHTSGAQLMLVCSISLDAVDNGNEYTGHASAYRYVYVAYNPSTPAGVLAVNPGVNDPWTTPLWCDNANAYHFVELQASGYFYDGTQNWYVVVHDTAGHVVFVTTQSVSSTVGAVALDNVVACLDNGCMMAVQTPADPNTSFFMSTDSLDLRVTSLGRRSQYFTSAGVRVEYTGLGSTTPTPLAYPDRGYALAGTVAGSRITVASSTDERKGLLSEEFLSCVPRKTRPNLLIDNGVRLHLQDGLVIGWDPDFGPMRY